MVTLNDVGTGNQRELWLFFILKFKTAKDPHLLGLLRENLVRECIRRLMESGQPRWEKGGNQSTFWVPSPDPAFGAVWVFSPSSLSTLSPSLSLKSLPSNIPFRNHPPVSCWARSLISVLQTSFWAEWYVIPGVSLSWAPLERRNWLYLSSVCAQHSPQCLAHSGDLANGNHCSL